MNWFIMVCSERSGIQIKAQFQKIINTFLTCPFIRVFKKVFPNSTISVLKILTNLLTASEATFTSHLFQAQLPSRFF